MSTKLSAEDPREFAKSKLIVALDVSNSHDAREIVEQLRGLVGMFKVGSQLFSAEGPAIVREIVESGEKIFLDLKFHDIPNTVAAAGVEATRLGVSIFNVHASGGVEMMTRTRDAVADIVDKEGLNKPTVIAVTVLTSSNDQTLREAGVDSSSEDQVVRLAKLADSSGLDGVVASPREIALIRSAVSNDNFVLVTPGVRPPGAAADDQKRTLSPREAIAAGANYLVVGRPILKADNPVKAAAAIVDEMAAGISGL
jgi:orotidine-5'-phosphate decarboxylase